MTVFNEILKKLEDVPNLKHEISKNSILVYPLNNNGFSTSLSYEGNEYVVFCEGWHEHFESPTEASRCFLWCLTLKCRLIVNYSSGKAYRWTLQSMEDNKWSDVGTTGLIFFNYFGKKTSQILQNNLKHDPTKS